MFNLFSSWHEIDMGKWKLIFNLMHDYNFAHYEKSVKECKGIL